MAERLSLYDIVDAEAFAGAIANHSRLELSFHDDADLREHLFAELWILSTQYEKTPGGPAFSAWATLNLKRRVVDWQ